MNNFFEIIVQGTTETRTKHVVASNSLCSENPSNYLEEKNREQRNERGWGGWCQCDACEERDNECRSFYDFSHELFL